MSIAYVQDTGSIIATGATAAATFSTNPVVGNNIFASACHSAGGSAATSYTVADNFSNTWTTDTTFDSLGDGRHVACVIGNAHVTTTGASFAVTLTQNGGGAANLSSVYTTYEFSGLATSSPFDVSATGNDTAGTTRTSPLNITSGAPVGGNELALMVYTITETATTLASLTPQSGFTQNASNLAAATTKVVGALSYHVIGNVSGAQTFGESVSPTTPVGSSSSKAASAFALYKAPTIVIFLTSGTSWLVPADWNNTANTVECIGTGCSGDASWGGGGGAYAKTTNVVLTPGANASYQIGIPGGTTANNSPSNTLNTWFSSGATVLAAGAPAGAAGTAGGLATNSVGTTKFDGGAGFNGAGGAGGPNGAGQAASGVSGQNGGAGNNGAAGGGAGGISGSSNGGNGTYWTSNPGGATAGPGGGGYADTTGGGANGSGGLYGGGGATSHYGGLVGTGQNGFIAITYHPIAVAAAVQPSTLMTTGAGT